MKHRRSIAFSTIISLPLVAGFLIVAAPQAAHGQAVRLVEVDVTIVAQGYRVSKILGKDVVNDKNEKIGTLEDIIVDKDRVMFAILEVGSFLGIPTHLVAVTHASMTIDPDGKKLILPGASREAVKKLAEFKYR